MLQLVTRPGILGLKDAAFSEYPIAFRYRSQTLLLAPQCTYIALGSLNISL